MEPERNKLTQKELDLDNIYCVAFLKLLTSLTLIVTSNFFWF